MKSRTAVIISVFIAILFVFLLLGYIAKIEEKAALDKDLKSVVVAKKNITKYSLLTPDMVKVMQMPSKYIQPGSITYVKGLVDEDNNPRFVTLIPIIEDEAITTTKLSLPGGTGLSMVIPNGQRAITIPVTSGISSSGLIRPGNKIDLIATFDEKSVFFLQDLLILSVGSKIIGEPEVKPSKKKAFLSGLTGGGSGGGTITVAVTPKQALKISFARGKCLFNIVLRNAADSEQVKETPITKNNLLGGTVKFKKSDGIEIYRGLEIFKQ